jgi:hypothetical protein
MIGPAELEDIRLDLQTALSEGARVADETFHPSFHPGAGPSPYQREPAPAEPSPVAPDHPSCVSSNSSGLSTGCR